MIDWVRPRQAGPGLLCGFSIGVRGPAACRVGGALIIIVFVPLLTLQGLEGKLFIPVALSIMFALAGSLLLALTVVPVATSFLLKAAPPPCPYCHDQ